MLRAVTTEILSVFRARAKLNRKVSRRFQTHRVIQAETLERRILLSGFAPTREFPNTSDTIQVFVDQLNTSGMTNAQKQFAATHFVGTQKQLPGEIDALRFYNPDFIMIQYRLGVRESTPPFIHNGTWSSDWSTVNANDDWFVRTNNAAARVYQNVGSVREYVMDISGRINGNTTNGWKEYWTQTVIADIDASRADGVFADSTHLPYAVPGNLWNSPIGSPPHTVYIDDMEDFYDYVYPQLDQAHKYFIPNIGALVTTADTTQGYYEDVHGAMVEGFGVRYDLDGPYAKYSEDDWRMQSNRILRLIGNEKIYIAETDESLAGPTDINSRLWFMSNFLLLKHDKSFINMFPGGNGLAGQLHWWPEYELDLGAPTESATAGGIGFGGSIDSLRDGNGVYSREFERGLVLVNPGDNTRTFTLNKAYQLVTPWGGGMVGANGQSPDGGLNQTPMSDGDVVTLAPQSGAILLLEAVRFDLGDAPAPYPTTLAENGASHVAVGPRLGNQRDDEPDGIHSENADGDDLHNIDDEDGVLFGGIAVTSSIAALNVLLENAASAKVDAWIDFNRDGAWDPLEKILDSVDVDQPLQTLNYNLPAGLTTGDTYARVRISAAGGLDPTGPAVDGEVEDYVVSIVAPPTVQSVVFNNGDVQRSSLKTVTLTFDRIVDIDSAGGDPFQFVNSSTGEIVTDVPVIDDSSGKTVVNFAFDRAGLSVTSFASLKNGNYRLTIDASLVTYLGVELDGKDNGTAGDDHVVDAADGFFRKYGDSNGNGVVDLLDFAAFRRTFGTSSGDLSYQESLDSDGDNTIGLLDFAAFRRGFGQ